MLPLGSSIHGLGRWGFAFLVLATGAPVRGATIEMKDCDTTRPGGFKLPEGTDLEKLRNDPEALAKLVEELGKPEKLVKKGRFKSRGKWYDIYLPESNEAYTVVNEGKGDSHHENTSTRVSIDADGDGKLTRDEDWFANRPIRLGDKMWDITAIAADGSRIDIKPSRKPLSGIVVGRKCPPFSYTTDGGKKISLRTYRRKALLVDVWSVT